MEADSHRYVSNSSAFRNYRSQYQSQRSEKKPSSRDPDTYLPSQELKYIRSGYKKDKQN
jgi:hypothetical protein